MRKSRRDVLLRILLLRRLLRAIRLLCAAALKLLAGSHEPGILSDAGILLLGLLQRFFGRFSRGEAYGLLNLAPDLR